MKSVQHRKHLICTLTVVVLVVALLGVVLHAHESDPTHAGECWLCLLSGAPALPIFAATLFVVWVLLSILPVSRATLHSHEYLTDLVPRAPPTDASV